MNHSKERRIIVEELIESWLKQIYGFSLNNTSNQQDAEDLSQEIVYKLYKVLLVRDDIENLESFIWRVAHNTLANYYRSKSRMGIVVDIKDIQDCLIDQNKSPEEQLAQKQDINRLQDEIAHLSRLRRQILIHYYYDGLSQEQIASLLSLPVGTVKWHLFEARKEIKKGMRVMKTVTDLKFNPIKFKAMGVNGSIGKMGGTSSFFRSTLSQNISWAVYREARSINEIADILGVSPVYIESEVEFLEEYGFLLKQPGEKYLANILIDGTGEKHEEIINLQDEMYTKAAKLIANDVFDELVNSEILKSKGIYYPGNDLNFLMWTLSMWVLAWSETDSKYEITFDEAATLRKDGGQYIALASIDDPTAAKPKLYDAMKNWCGPMWNDNGNLVLWQINNQWCDRTTNLDSHSGAARQDMKLLYRFIGKSDLSPDEYAALAEKKYITGHAGNYKLNLIWINDNETKEKLLEIGSRVKNTHLSELDAIKSRYIDAILKNTPKHLRKMQAFGLQYIFKSDGWFLLHSIVELLNTGRLKPLKDKQKSAVLTLIITK